MAAVFVWWIVGGGSVIRLAAVVVWWMVRGWSMRAWSQDQNQLGGALRLMGGAWEEWRGDDYSM
jgi:hypothetical protein